MNALRTSPTRARLAVTLSAAVLAAGGAAGVSAAQDPVATGGQTHAPAGQATPPAASPAATLRAGLTALFQEHVYLAGIAIDTGVRDGLRSRSYRAAAAELDDNSQAVAGAVGDVYGRDAERRVLRLWREHIAHYVQYTRGRLAGDRAVQRRAQRGLAEFAEELSRLLAAANPNLPAEGLEREIAVHGAQTLRIIDATVARSVRAYPRLQQGAAHMTGLAAVLSTAIATQFPERFPG
jgi:hypothetical protein